MNSLEAYKFNYQTIYHNSGNAKICAINLMEIGKDYFKSTYKYNNLEKLEAISKYLNNMQDPPRDLYIDFALNNLLDSVKIGICFENYFKAQLLANDFLVHKLDTKLFLTFCNEQKRRPINIKELLTIAQWEPYEKIHPKFPEAKTLRIKGLLENSISYTILLNKAEYYEHFIIDSSILHQLKLINADRNKLHLNVSNSTLLFPDSYNKFKLIVDFVENEISNSITSLFDELEISYEHRQFQEITERVPITSDALKQRFQH